MTNPLTLSRLEDRVHCRLTREPPGFGVQKPLAPRSLDGTYARGPDGPQGIPAAALALLYARDGVSHLILTVRSDRLPHHGGQISLPGGTLNPHETLEEAALRETQEEIDVPPTSVRLAGRLTSVFIPPSGFRLHPLVGFAHDDLAPVPNPGEVSQILEVPVSHLLDRKALGKEVRHLRGRDFEIPYYRVGNHKVWGATAMVLSELLWILGGGDHPDTDGVTG